MKIAGIDYGSKLAGTTVIAYPGASEIHFAASQKKQDADRFITEWVAEHQPDVIFIDAPLSLPGVYQQLEGFSDYFYREADRELKAMSPMFLGGLTARAMRLAEQLKAFDRTLLEVYPGHLARTLDLPALSYKKEKSYIPIVTNFLQARFPSLTIVDQLPDWHHVDALLALISGLRFLEDIHLIFGQKAEGQIIV